MTDGPLLQAFIHHRDEAAFESLLRLHGPMVLGVCRRVLGNHHDAEEAFQATFLVLSRKAASIRSSDQVGNWLYGVAYRTSLKAKSLRDLRRTKEGQIMNASEPATDPPSPWCDVAPLLDRELNALPEKYRRPIVLCEIEGRTHKEVAHELGCPESTISGRLMRARDLLQKRLARQGVVMSASTLAVLITQNAASAAVPMSLLTSTTHTVGLLTARNVSTTTTNITNIAALAQESTKAVLFAAVTIVAALLLGMATLGWGIQTFRQPKQASTAISPAENPLDVPTIEQLLAGLERYEQSFFEHRQLFLNYARVSVETVTPSKFSGGDLRTEWTFARNGDLWRSERKYLDPGDSLGVTVPSGSFLQIVRNRKLVEWSEHGQRASIVDFSKESLNFYQGLIYTRNLSLDAPRWIAKNNGSDAAAVRKNYPDDANLPFLPEWLRVNQAKYRVNPVQETIHGHRCWVVEWPGMDQIWIAAELGYAVPRRRYHWGADQPLRYDWTHDDFREVKPGLWVPFLQIEDRYTSVLAESESLWGKVATRCRYELKSIKFDDLSEDLFQTKLPVGTTVIDNARGWIYRVEGPSEADPFSDYLPSVKRAIPLQQSQPNAFTMNRSRSMTFLVINIIVLVCIGGFVYLKKRT